MPCSRGIGKQVPQSWLESSLQGERWHKCLEKAARGLWEPGRCGKRPPVFFHIYLHPHCMA